MKARRVLAVTVVLVIAVAFVAVHLFQGPNYVNEAPSPVVIHSNIHLGLELTATITPTKLAEGQSVSVVAEVNDTLSNQVEVNSTSMTNTAFGPCEQGFATGVQVYSGNYTYLQLFNNGSQPTPLLLYNPSLAYSCPAVFTFTYTFHPNSAIATVQGFLGGAQSIKNQTHVVEETSVVDGYWTGSGQSFSFHALQPGSYTVVVYDAWGDRLIGYFEVI